MKHTPLFLQQTDKHRGLPSYVLAYIKVTALADQGAEYHRIINQYECHLGGEKYGVPAIKRVGGSYMRPCVQGHGPE